MLIALTMTACSLTAPDPTPLVITATPLVTSTLAITATAVPQLATRPPTVTPTPTNAPCTTRDDWFVYTVSAGDTLAGIALRAGVSVDQLSLANCIEPDTALNADEGVRVPVAVLPPAAPTENSACAVQWFFVFRTGESEITVSCPESLVQVEAIGQDFEGGRMLRFLSTPVDSSAVVYVIYNNGFWEVYPDTWDATQPASDDTLVPPRHRIQPTESFGKVWRENAAVRTGLGWAYSPPIPFTGRMQFPEGRTDYWYLDYGSARLALRLVRSDVAPNPWKIVGEF